MCVPISTFKVGVGLKVVVHPVLIAKYRFPMLTILQIVELVKEDIQILTAQFVHLFLVTRVRLR